MPRDGLGQGSSFRCTDDGAVEVDQSFGKCPSDEHRPQMCDGVRMLDVDIFPAELRSTKKPRAAPTRRHDTSRTRRVLRGEGIVCDPSHLRHDSRIRTEGCKYLHLAGERAGADVKGAVLLERTVPSAS